MDQINIQQIHPSAAQAQPQNVRPAPGKEGVFRDLLEQTIARQDGIKFSAHAIDRLRTRNILLCSEDIIRINEAVQKAENKGSRDTLILMNGMAFIVSIKNKTVVTAITGEQMQDKIITNIDSTIIA